MSKLFITYVTIDLSLYNNEKSISHFPFFDFYFHVSSKSYYIGRYYFREISVQRYSRGLSISRWRSLFHSDKREYTYRKMWIPDGTRSRYPLWRKNCQRMQFGTIRRFFSQPRWKTSINLCRLGTYLPTLIQSHLLHVRDTQELIETAFRRRKTTSCRILS